MNRQQRRAAKHRKPVIRKPLKTDKILCMQYAFEPIDRILDTLESGYWLRKNGEVLITHDRYEYYPILPALDGWLSYWKNAQSKFDFTADFNSLETLKNWIENDIIETPDEVIADVRKLVANMKKVYIKTPFNQIRDHAATMSLAFALEQIETIA